MPKAAVHIYKTSCRTSIETLTTPLEVCSMKAYLELFDRIDLGCVPPNGVAVAEEEVVNTGIGVADCHSDNVPC